MTDSTALYRFLKWTWLLGQCLMPVLAAVYLSRHPGLLAAPPGLTSPFATALYRLLLHVSASAYLILWLIAEAMLCMYRFPLRTAGAAGLVGGFLLQFAVLAVTGQSACFAAFTGLYVTLAALFACLVWLGLAAATRQGSGRGRPGGLAAWAPAVALLALGILPLAFLFRPWWAAFAGLRPAFRAVNGLILLLNAAATARTLAGFSIWGRTDPQETLFYREWEKWAAPTIILLILTVVGAILVAGISGAVSGGGPAE
ncbi:MAG TPA: hypothetical protein P5567_15145 [Kiritimatiellia bacterium]|nr:hypothetical protein [Kiritimatiellia bacterium]HRZ13778.1 hypothetical protein [Kiritimatiellia bacterium]HSA19717.1 hypothetical protein [Kiritimatiellia bacterium]